MIETKIVPPNKDVVKLVASVVEQNSLIVKTNRELLNKLCLNTMIVNGNE